MNYRFMSGEVLPSIRLNTVSLLREIGRREGHMRADFSVDQRRREDWAISRGFIINGIIKEVNADEQRPDLHLALDRFLRFYEALQYPEAAKILTNVTSDSEMQAICARAGIHNPVFYGYGSMRGGMLAKDVIGREISSQDIDILFAHDSADRVTPDWYTQVAYRLGELMRDPNIEGVRRNFFRLCEGWNPTNPEARMYNLTAESAKELFSRRNCCCSIAIFFDWISSL